MCNHCTKSLRRSVSPYGGAEISIHTKGSENIMDMSVDQIKEIICSDSDMKETIDAMPPNLSLKHIIRFLGMPESTVYKITRQPSFPKLDVGISSFIVPRPLFLYWYYQHCFFPSA